MLRFVYALGVVSFFAGPAQPAALLDIMQSELTRNFTALKEKADPQPYFISYSIVENNSEVISSNFGAVHVKTHGRTRTLDVSVRVGSPKFDNYHIVRGQRAQFGGAISIPLDDNSAAIKRLLWQHTDSIYRAASQRFTNLLTSKELNVAAEDTSDDFSSETPSQASQPPKSVAMNEEEWATRVRKWSGEFKKYPGLLSGNVVLMLQTETKNLVNTEGTKLAHGRGFMRVLITAQAKAQDGMDLSAMDSFEAADPSGLPSDAEVMKAVDRVAGDVQALLKAPIVEPFVGPAILSGKASGVFFHEIFGHRIEGHRQRDETEGQTFTKSVNTPVLPNFLSVVFDPTRARINNVDLNGFYTYDDEGVKARPVTLVDKGILKTFLLSRNPIKGFEHSNGHGRRQAGREVVSRQSNLIVESSKQVSDKELRDLLIAEIKRQNKPYGFFFRDITGGYTLTTRESLQAFKVIPLVVYRVYPDGKPDELVRGVDIVGTPLSSFARIMATGNQAQVFNGYCGAESGNVPVSAVSPAILVSEIEIEKKSRANDTPPILPSPAFSAGGGE